MAIKFDKQKRKEIQEVLTSTYIHVDGIERNKELENSIIRKNKVNFKLTVNLSNGILDEWEKLHNICKTGYVTIAPLRAKSCRNRCISV